MDKPNVFFDCDGTIVTPLFEFENGLRAGFLAEHWVEYCNARKEHAYDDCILIPATLEFARQCKTAGLSRTVVTVALSEGEAAAKRALFAKPPLSDLFTELVLVDSDGAKVQYVLDHAGDTKPILVDDRYDVILYAMGCGVNAIHMSHVQLGVAGILAGLRREDLSAPLTKRELKLRLLAGERLDEIVEIRPGQECEIVKAREFTPGDSVIYISDLWLHDIPTDKPIRDPDVLRDLLDSTYTGDDFIETCHGSEQLARELFGYVNWQSPDSALPEVESND